MRRLKLVVLAFLLSLCFQSPCFAEEIDRPPKTITGDNPYALFKGMDRPYKGPLPWNNNPRFLETLKKFNNLKLMAAYKASLPDPIEAEGYNIGLAAQQLAGAVVEPGQVFSQNQTIGPYTEYRGYKTGPTYVGTTYTTTVGGGVCKIATMLYNVATFCDLKIIQRRCHSMTVPYVPPGQDATVYYGVTDFRFQNDTDGPILIWSEKVGDTLYMAFYGTKTPPEVVWHHKIIRRIPYWTAYRYDPSLAPGTEKTVHPGQDGYIVKSWVTVKTPDGKEIKKKKAMSYYNASPEIIVRGPRPRKTETSSILQLLQRVWSEGWRPNTPENACPCPASP